MRGRDPVLWLIVVGGIAVVVVTYLLSPAPAAEPTPTPPVTVTAPPATVTITAPPRTVYVTRPSRAYIPRPPIPSPLRRIGSVPTGAPLDLRHAALWDRIAKCESGGRWNLNTGRFDGGLQWLPSTWRSWGGTDFAPYAWQATRAQQITIANRSTRSRVGEPWLKPWPVCGKRAAAALGYRFP